MWLLRSKGGVKQWKDSSWPFFDRGTLILYKDESEYTANFILPAAPSSALWTWIPLAGPRSTACRSSPTRRAIVFAPHDEETLSC